MCIVLLKNLQLPRFSLAPFHWFFLLIVGRNWLVGVVLMIFPQCLVLFCCYSDSKDTMRVKVVAYFGEWSHVSTVIFGGTACLIAFARPLSDVCCLGSLVIERSVGTNIQTYPEQLLQDWPLTSRLILLRDWPCLEAVIVSSSFRASACCSPKYWNSIHLKGGI